MATHSITIENYEKEKKALAIDTAKKVSRHILATGDIHQQMEVDVDIPINATKDEIEELLSSLIILILSETDRVSKLVLPRELMEVYNTISWTTIQRTVSKYVTKIIFMAMTAEEQKEAIDLVRKQKNHTFKRCCLHCRKEETGKEKIKMKKCGKCKFGYYCDAECQKKDWAEHRKTCNS